MKDKHQLFALFALTLSLDIPLLETLLRAVFEYENSSLSKDSPRTSVSTETELIAAIADHNVTYIILTTDIILYNNLVFNRDLTLDLNGYKLASLTANARVIDIVSGNVTLTGKGSIVANGIGAAAVRIKGAITADNTHYSSILVDEDVTLYAPNYYGLFVTPNCQAAYGVEVNFRGSMIARDGFCVNGSIRGQGSNAPYIKIADSARITVDENDGIAIYASGYANWKLGAAEIIGATGIGVRTGDLTLVGTTIIATGPLTEIGDWNEGMPSCGAVIQLDTTHDDNISVKLNGGEYLSRGSYVFLEGGWAHAASSNQNLYLDGGSFTGSAGIFYGSNPHSVEHSVVHLERGNFAGNVNDYLSAEVHSEYSHSLRMYQVSPKVIPAAPSPRVELNNLKTELGSLLLITSRYLSESYSNKELGDLQPEVDKALAAARRSKKAAEKLLSPHREATAEQVKSMIRRVAKSNTAIQTIEDDLRTDILSSIAAARAIDPQDYSAYSYRILMESVQDADILLVQRHASLIDLYSVFCDIDMNLDLLDEPEDDEEPLEATFLAPSPAEPTPSAPVPALLSAPVAIGPMPTSSIASTPPITFPADSIIDPGPDHVSEISDYNNLSDDAPLLLSDSDLTLIETAQTTIDTIAVLGALALAESSPINERMLEARENLRSLLNAITVLNPSDYSTESYRNLHDMVVSASSLLAEPDENLSVDLLLVTYQRVNSAYTALVKKSQDPTLRAYDEACANLYTMLEVAKDLNLSDYDVEHAEQFGELQVAIAKANVDLRNPNVSVREILDVMDEIKLATTGLKVNFAHNTPSQTDAPDHSLEEAPATYIQPASTAQTTVTAPIPAPIQEAQVINSPTPTYSTPAPDYSSNVVAEPVSQVSVAAAAPSPTITLDWSNMREAISDIAALNPAEYTSETYNHLLAQLEYTKTIFGDPRLTQDMIDDIVFELNLSVLSLERISTESTPPSVYETALTPQPTVQPSSISTDISQPNVTPNLLMSMMAGAYAGLATYRRSRIEAKQRK